MSCRGGHRTRVPGIPRATGAPRPQPQGCDDVRLSSASSIHIGSLLAWRVACTCILGCTAERRKLRPLVGAVPGCGGCRKRDFVAPQIHRRYKCRQPDSHERKIEVLRNAEKQDSTKTHKHIAPFQQAHAFQRQCCRLRYALFRLFQQDATVLIRTLDLRQPSAALGYSAHKTDALTVMLLARKIEHDFPVSPLCVGFEPTIQRMRICWFATCAIRTREVSLPSDISPEMALKLRLSLLESDSLNQARTTWQGGWAGDGGKRVVSKYNTHAGRVQVFLRSLVLFLLCTYIRTISFADFFCSSSLKH